MFSGDQVLNENRVPFRFERRVNIVCSIHRREEKNASLQQKDEKDINPHNNCLWKNLTRCLRMAFSLGSTGISDVANHD